MNPLIAYHKAGKERSSLWVRDVRTDGGPLWVSGKRGLIHSRGNEGIELDIPHGLTVSFVENAQYPYVYGAPDGNGGMSQTVILEPGEWVTLRRPRGTVSHTIEALASGPNDGRLALQQIAAMRAAQA